MKRSGQERQQFYGAEFKVRPFLKYKGSLRSLKKISIKTSKTNTGHFYSLFFVLAVNKAFFDCVMKPEMQIPVLAVYYSDIDSKLLSLFIDDVDKDLFE